MKRAITVTYVVVVACLLVLLAAGAGYTLHQKRVQGQFYWNEQFSMLADSIATRYNSQTGLNDPTIQSLLQRNARVKLVAIYRDGIRLELLDVTGNAGYIRESKGDGQYSYSKLRQSIKSTSVQTAKSGTVRLDAIGDLINYEEMTRVGTIYLTAVLALIILTILMLILVGRISDEPATDDESAVGRKTRSKTSKNAATSGALTDLDADDLNAFDIANANYEYTEALPNMDFDDAEPSASRLAEDDGELPPPDDFESDWDSGAVLTANSSTELPEPVEIDSSSHEPTGFLDDLEPLDDNLDGLPGDLEPLDATDYELPELDDLPNDLEPFDDTLTELPDDFETTEVAPDYELPELDDLPNDPEPFDDTLTELPYDFETPKTAPDPEDYLQELADLDADPKQDWSQEEPPVDAGTHVESEESSNPEETESMLTEALTAAAADDKDLTVMAFHMQGALKSETLETVKDFFLNKYGCKVHPLEVGSCVFLPGYQLDDARRVVSEFLQEMRERDESVVCGLSARSTRSVPAEALLREAAAAMHRATAKSQPYAAYAFRANVEKYNQLMDSTAGTISA